MFRTIFYLWSVKSVSCKCNVLTKMSHLYMYINENQWYNFFSWKPIVSCQQYVSTVHHHYLVSFFSYLLKAAGLLWTLYFFQSMQCLLSLVESLQLQFHFPFATNWNLLQQNIPLLSLLNLKSLFLDSLCWRELYLLNQWSDECCAFSAGWGIVKLVVSFVLIQKTEKLISPKLSIMFCIEVIGVGLVCPLNSLIVCLKTFVIDRCCLLVFLSVYAVPIVTSKVTIDDTYSRCPMVEFFLMEVLPNRNSKIVFDTKFQ